MTTTLAGRGRPDAGPLARRLALATCVVACFGLAFRSAMTWDDVQAALAEGFRGHLESATSVTEAGDPYREASGLALALLGAWALATARRSGRLRIVGLLGGAVAAYLALYLVSAAWSDDPLLAGRRAAGLATMLVAVLGLVRLLDDDALVSFALLGSASYVLLAAVAELARGAFHPLAAGYRFSGLFHPNVVGAFAAILVMAASCANRRKIRPWIVAAAIGLGGGVLLLTRSRSALLGLGAALVVRWVALARPSTKALVLAFAAWTAGATYLALGDDLVPTARGALMASRADSRIATLSGRTGLWRELLDDVAERPALGHGLGGFWDPSRIEAIYASQGWPVTQAHSLYVEQLLDTGGVGLALFLIVALGAMWRAVRLLRATRDGAHSLMVCVLAYVLAAGTLESLLPAPSFQSFLFFWALSSLAFDDRTRPGGSARWST